MIESVSISNFRCFSEFSIDQLRQFNLIAGKNCVGKTALLEALFLLLGASNISLVLTLSGQRGIEKVKGDPGALRDALWRPFFHDFRDATAVVIQGTFEGPHEETVRLRCIPSGTLTLPLNDGGASASSAETRKLPESALELEYVGGGGKTEKIEMRLGTDGVSFHPRPHRPPHTGHLFSASSRISQQQAAERFGDLEVEPGNYTTQDLLSALQIVEPRLRRVTTISGPSGSLLHGDVGLTRMVPLPLLGEGLVRLTCYLAAIANSANGFVLIDEIDNGFHHSVLDKVWRAIGQAASRVGTQVFATTHSFECIRAAHHAFAEAEKRDFRLHRLERSGEGIRAVSYDDESLDTAIQAELEVR